MLGQFIRFYLPFIPTFLVVILQIYDFSLLLLVESTDKLDSCLLLDHFHSNYVGHLFFSYFLALISYLIPYYGNDYELLKLEDIDNFLLAFLLYWAAYAILNTVSLFSSLNHMVISFSVNRIVGPMFKCLNFSLARRFGFFLHFIIMCVAGFFSSALVHCILFYSMAIHLALNNPRYSRPPFDYIRLVQ